MPIVNEKSTKAQLLEHVRRLEGVLSDLPEEHEWTGYRDEIANYIRESGLEHLVMREYNVTVSFILTTPSNLGAGGQEGLFVADARDWLTDAIESRIASSKPCVLVDEEDWSIEKIDVHLRD